MIKTKWTSSTTHMSHYMITLDNYSTMYFSVEVLISESLEDFPNLDTSNISVLKWLDTKKMFIMFPSREMPRSGEYEHVQNVPPSL